MPTKTITMFDSPGLVRDLPEQFIKENAVTDLRNVRFNRYGAETMPGDGTIFSPASITPKWVSPFPPITAPIWVYADLTSVWAFDGTTHFDITRTASAYNGTVTERWNSCVLAGYGFFNNGVDVPQSWQAFDTSNLLIDLANWDGTRKCKVLRSFKNFLIALNMTDSGTSRPYRVLWSSPAAPGALPPSWDSTDPAQEASEIDLSETPDHLVDCLPLGDVNVIYKEASTWGMSYIGPPFHFRFYEILPTRGALHRDCMTRFPGGHVVATTDDLIMHSGTRGSERSLVNRKLRQWLFSAIDSANYYESFAFTYPAKDEVWFCFPESGATNVTMAIVWNYVTDSIGVRELTETPFISMGPIGDSFNTDLIWDVAV